MRRIGLAVMLIVSLLTPLVLQAEQARKVWRIGLIAVAPRKDQNAVFQGFRELGYVEVFPLHVAKFSEALKDGVLILSGRDRDQADPPDLPRLFRLQDERRKKADNEHDREPDPPHGHLGWNGWRESSRRRRIAGAGRAVHSSSAHRLIS